MIISATMKKMVIVGSLLAIAIAIIAQETATVTADSASNIVGKVQSTSAGALEIKTADQQTYLLTVPKDIVAVDTTGGTIAPEKLAIDASVTVKYKRQGGKLVVESITKTGDVAPAPSVAWPSPKMTPKTTPKPRKPN
jgi:hypothetical protein